jgi:phage baseplate assembly protein W
VVTAKVVLAMLDEAYEKKTWHGPNLKQSLKGVSVVQAAWRPGAGRHNIWEEALHAAYWKYAVRRRIEGNKRGSFALKGSNFFPRPETGNATEAAWAADKKLLECEHRALCSSVAKVLRTPRGHKFLRQLYGVAFHDVYHAGQIRLLRRLQRPEEAIRERKPQTRRKKTTIGGQELRRARQKDPASRFGLG